MKNHRYLSASEIQEARENMVMLMVLIMMILIIMMIIIMKLAMMMNTEKLEALEDYLKNLIEIITSQQELMMVLMGEETITQNMRVEEMDRKISHQKNILI